MKLFCLLILTFIASIGAKVAPTCCPGCTHPSMCCCAPDRTIMVTRWITKTRSTKSMLVKSTFAKRAELPLQVAPMHLCPPCGKVDSNAWCCRPKKTITKTITSTRLVSLRLTTSTTTTKAVTTTTTTTTVQRIRFGLSASQQDLDAALHLKNSSNVVLKRVKSSAVSALFNDMSPHLFHVNLTLNRPMRGVQIDKVTARIDGGSAVDITSLIVLVNVSVSNLFVHATLSAQPPTAARKSFQVTLLCRVFAIRTVRARAEQLEYQPFSVSVLFGVVAPGSLSSTSGVVKTTSQAVVGSTSSLLVSASTQSSTSVWSSTPDPMSSSLDASSLVPTSSYSLCASDSSTVTFPSPSFSTSITSSIGASEVVSTSAVSSTPKLSSYIASASSSIESVTTNMYDASTSSIASSASPTDSQSASTNTLSITNSSPTPVLSESSSQVSASTSVTFVASSTQGQSTFSTQVTSSGSSLESTTETSTTERISESSTVYVNQATSTIQLSTTESTPSTTESRQSTTESTTQSSTQSTSSSTQSTSSSTQSTSSTTQSTSSTTQSTSSSTQSTSSSTQSTTSTTQSATSTTQSTSSTTQSTTQSTTSTTQSTTSTTQSTTQSTSSTTQSTTQSTSSTTQSSTPSTSSTTESTTQSTSSTTQSTQSTSTQTTQSTTSTTSINEYALANISELVSYPEIVVPDIVPLAIFTSGNVTLFASMLQEAIEVGNQTRRPPSMPKFKSVTLLGRVATFTWEDSEIPGIPEERYQIVFLGTPLNFTSPGCNFSMGSSRPTDPVGRGVRSITKTFDPNVPQWAFLVAYNSVGRVCNDDSRVMGFLPRNPGFSADRWMSDFLKLDIYDQGNAMARSAICIPANDTLPDWGLPLFRNNEFRVYRNETEPGIVHQCHVFHRNMVGTVVSAPYYIIQSAEYLPYGYSQVTTFVPGSDLVSIRVQSLSGSLNNFTKMDINCFDWSDSYHSTCDNVNNPCDWSPRRNQTTVTIDDAFKTPYVVNMTVLALWPRCELVVYQNRWIRNVWQLDVNSLVDPRVVSGEMASAPTDFTYNSTSKVFSWKDGLPAMEEESYIVHCVVSGNCTQPPVATLEVPRGVQQARANWTNVEGTWRCWVKSANSVGQQCSNLASVTYIVDFIGLGLLVPPPTNLAFNATTRTLSWMDSPTAASPAETYAWKCVSLGGVCSDTALVEGFVARGVRKVVFNWTEDVDYDCFVRSRTSYGEMCSLRTRVEYESKTHLIANRTIAAPARSVTGNGTLFTWLDANVSALSVETYTLKCVIVGETCNATALFEQNVNRGVQRATFQPSPRPFNASCFVISQNVNGFKCSRPANVTYKPNYFALGMVSRASSLRSSFKSNNVRISWAVSGNLSTQFIVECRRAQLPLQIVRVVVPKNATFADLDLEMGFVFSCSVTVVNDVAGRRRQEVSQEVATDKSSELIVATLPIPPISPPIQRLLIHTETGVNVTMDGTRGFPLEHVFVECDSVQFNKTYETDEVQQITLPTNVPHWCNASVHWMDTVNPLGNMIVPPIPPLLRVTRQDFHSADFEFDAWSLDFPPSEVVVFCSSPTQQCLTLGDYGSADWTTGRGKISRLSPGTAYFCRLGLIYEDMNGDLSSRCGPGVNVSIALPPPRKPGIQKIQSLYGYIAITGNNTAPGYYYTPICVHRGQTCEDKPRHSVPLLLGDIGVLTLAPGPLTCYWVAITTTYTCSDPVDIEVRNVTLTYTVTAREAFARTWYTFLSSDRMTYVWWTFETTPAVRIGMDEEVRFTLDTPNDLATEVKYLEAHLKPNVVGLSLLFFQPAVFLLEIQDLRQYGIPIPGFTVNLWGYSVTDLAWIISVWEQSENLLQ